MVVTVKLPLRATVGIRQILGPRGVIPVARSARRALGLIEDLRAEMPFIGPALANLVDHAAVGATVARVVTAGEHLLLVDRAIGQAEAAKAVQWIGGVEAVDVIRVLCNRRTAK